MRSPKFFSSPEGVLVLRLLIAFALSGIAACSLFRPAPPAPPQGALLVLQAPTPAKVRILDDAGNSMDLTVTIPQGWGVMDMGPNALSITANK